VPIGLRNTTESTGWRYSDRYTRHAVGPGIPFSNTHAGNTTCYSITNLPDSARVTWTMIVRYQESNLPHSLESVRGLFDEIVIVDTGSRDFISRVLTMSRRTEIGRCSLVCGC
jgi:hypothetical protein